MLNHILTAVDFTIATPQLYARLQTMRDWGTRRITLLYVLRSQYPEAPEVSHREHYERRLAAAARDLEAEGFQVDWQVRTGNPPAEIVAAARKVGADTVMAGTRSESKLSDRFLGSTALNLARVTDLPLWLEPIFQEPAVRPAKTILLATDGSPSAEGAGAALRTLQPRAERSIVLTVASDGKRTPETLHALKGVESRVATGDPRERIVAIAGETRTDLIILGKRGHTVLRDLMLGSTAESVCRRSGCPVLLVP